MGSGWALLWPQLSEATCSPRAFVWGPLDLGFLTCSSAELLGPAALSALITDVTPEPCWCGCRFGGGNWSTILCWNLSFITHLWVPGPRPPRVLLQRDGFLSPLRWDESWRACSGATLSPGQERPQDWALENSHRESSPLLWRSLWAHSQGLLFPPPAWATGIFLGLPGENMVGLLEIKPRTAWASPDTAATRSFSPSCESSLRLRRGSVSPQGSCQLLPPSAPDPGEQVLAWPSASPVSPDLRWWSVTRPHFSDVSRQSWFLVCSAFPGCGWKWKLQSSGMSELKPEVSCFKELKREKQPILRTQILNLFCCSSSPCEVLAFLWSLSQQLEKLPHLFFHSRSAGDTSGFLLLRRSQHHLYWRVYHRMWNSGGLHFFEPRNHWVFCYRLILCLLMRTVRTFHTMTHTQGNSAWNVLTVISRLFSVFASQQFDSDMCTHDSLWIYPVWGSLVCLNT